MILRIRNSFLGKVTSFVLIGAILLTLNPTYTFALTGGPAQPEFNSFTPIGTSDMVDLSSGDFSYNIPLMDVGGFPINLAYNSGVTMDQEASWVGLGWNLSIGQINRQMRGLPDDFDGDEIQYEKNQKPNTTIGADFTINPALFGLDADVFNTGMDINYNTYNGVTIAHSFGASFKINESLSLGFGVKSSPDGLSVNPNVNFKAKTKTEKNRNASLKSSVGLSYNSRKGLGALTFEAEASAGVQSNKENSKLKSVGGQHSVGSTVSYVNNTYTPSVQDGMDNYSFTFNASTGLEFFGAEGQGEITAYSSTSKYSESAKNNIEKGYGYDNNHLATKYDVKDFNREKDGNFSVNSTNLPLTNFTYDIYSVQGQGVSGMFRPFRSQIGYVNDNFVSNIGVGATGGAEFGGGSAFHAGLDIEVSESYSYSGVWEDDNNAISTMESESTPDQVDYEEVFYKNVGDLSVDEEYEDLYGIENGLGGFRPVRVKMAGSEFARTLEDDYEIKVGLTSPSISEGYLDHAMPTDGVKRDQRVKRNQTIQKLTKQEIVDASGDGVVIPGFEVNSNAEPHHTAGFIVTRNDGARYTYGKALYNTTKREVTFSVNGSTADCETGLVTYSSSDNSVANGNGDKYFDRITTPAYAHTYLLTSLVSSDYSDINNDGLTADDLGSYTKFEYNNKSNYSWRVPFNSNSANFNEGLKTDPDDDKGSYVYGEKEMQYIRKIETKTHVATFTISKRDDARGVGGENGGASGGAYSYKLDKISLYSIGEFYDASGAIVGGGTDAENNITTTATPIKEVHFEYDYSLCPGVDNNENSGTDDGKLTLKSMYFTYRNSEMGKYSPYDFTYSSSNPFYNLKGYDYWGNYKENPNTDCGVIDDISAPEFMYTDQDGSTTNADMSAWSLEKIDLPSGGTIQVTYEADDYAYVQDKEAMRMVKVVGAGDTSDPTGEVFEPDAADDDATLYKKGTNSYEAEYLYVEIPSSDTETDNATEFYENYLKQIYDDQKGLMQFRFFTNMTLDGGRDLIAWTAEDFEYVSGYAELDPSSEVDYFEISGTKYGSIPIKQVDMEGGVASGTNVNPISKASWHFARKYLGRFAYGLSGVDEGESVEGIIYQLTGASLVNNLIEIFQGPNGALRSKNVGRRFIKEKSWVRLMEPTGFKKGGGCRVQQIIMTDEWAQMNSDDAAVVTDDIRDQKYGQQYIYTSADGSKSSGVATYEPVGAKDNPFVQPVFVNEKRLLAPDEENYMEKPFGESFFPSPTVTYGRVEVKNLERIDDNGTPGTTADDIRLTRHATGSVVTEFYTSKDYPTRTDQTRIVVEEDDNSLLAGLLNINVKNHITLSQGYTVVLNDMNGKMKSQRVYAEGAEGVSDYISGVDYVYDGFSFEDGDGPSEPSGLIVDDYGDINNKVMALFPDGTLNEHTLGIEVDVINDFREMYSESTTVGVNTNVATFFIGIIPGIVPVPFPDYNHHEDLLRMVSTTKVVNTFGVLRETVAHDVGASVKTRNLVWDAATGEVLITQTVNEYGDKYYSMNYPAHWYYSGMGLASTNANLEVNINGTSGNYSIGSYTVDEDDFLENGDEVLVTTVSSGAVQRCWVEDVTSSNFDLTDETGTSVTLTGGHTMKVLRSGKRNIQSTQMASVVLMDNPVDLMQNLGDIDSDGEDEYKLYSGFLEVADWDDGRIVNAGAVEFQDEWPLLCECGLDSLDNYNDYLFNKKGIWRAKRSHLYLTGRKQSTVNPDPRNDGFYESFSPFYYVNAFGNWGIDYSNWTFTSQVTKFNTHGFEIENQDALERYSAALYGYNFKFPLAVGANTSYAEIAYDGLEDYAFGGCDENQHFGFKEEVAGDPDVSVSDVKAHTGNFSLKVAANQSFTKTYHVACPDPAAP
ncbi:MAG: hypothetical protein MK078_05970 [Crocinitomicaceae bacterium]|nr:hypothetical protein [Crocinitomicaceae bacterium]